MKIVALYYAAWGPERSAARVRIRVRIRIFTLALIVHLVYLLVLVLILSSLEGPRFGPPATIAELERCQIHLSWVESRHAKTVHEARSGANAHRAPQSAIDNCSCLRLKKECFFRPARPRYNPAKKETRLEALEAKLDQFISQRSGPTRHTSNSPAVSDGERALGENDSRDVIGRGVIGLAHAESLLDVFRYSMMPHFPFVMLSAHMTLSWLREERPCLLLAVFLVASKENITCQRTLEDAFKELVAERMIFTHAPSMDLFQGLLSRVPRNSSYLSLAWGLVSDLRLDQLSAVQSSQSRMSINDGDDPIEGSSVSFLQEQKRALIGYFFLSSRSSNSALLQRGSMRTNLPCIETYARDLFQSCEFPSDRYLVDLRIFERIDVAVTTTDQAGTGFNTYALQAEIDNEKERLREAMIDNNLFLCQASLFEKNSSILFSDASFSPSNMRATLLPDPQRSKLCLNLSPEAIGVLCRGLVAAKDFFDFFTTCDGRTDRVIGFVQWLQSGFDLVLACKLVVTASRCGMHNQTIRTLCDALNMSQILRDILQRLEVVRGNRRGSDGTPSAKTFYESWLWRIYAWFQQHYQPTTTEAHTRMLPGSSNVTPTGFITTSNVSSWGAPPTYIDYSHGKHARPDEVDCWPDFCWNMTMNDILYGQEDFLNIPFDPSENWT
ncbi:uncharacterized protein N7459_010035 [Penicillium hispanicum]|uniref:uncharacterized protein n=1 Tax=Penicillium hispanicum TaxID=1080232 RepID=UPI00253F7696|nr:uncharacterized protein N7459_010035 [Penicillium hispanicum]KAJ5570605.1 hypothetical protein N7459_010035 [Penicillium hispanicum]